MRTPRVSAVVLLLVISLAHAYADTVKTDLLLGIGDFAKSIYTMRVGGCQLGDPCEPNDTIANGWRRDVSSGLTKDNIVFNLTKAPGYQYMGVKGIKSGVASWSLTTSVAVDGSNPLRPHAGDKVTLVLDRIRMQDWNLPYVTLDMSVYCGDSPRATKRLAYSATDFSDSVSYVIPPGATSVVILFNFYSNGDLGTHEPAVLLSGAHLYLTRAGKTDYETESIPAMRDRSITTLYPDSWEETRQGVRYTAGEYDEVVLNAWAYPCFSALKKLNPSIRLYLYQGATANDTQLDECWALDPFRFSDVEATYPAWLYRGTPGKDGYKYVAPYPDRFPLHLINAKYQDLWASKVISKARTLGVDGIFMDECFAFTTTHEGIKRDPYEVQQFYHSIVPRLKSAGLVVASCLAGANLNGSLGWDGDSALVYFSPVWKPDSRFTASAGYSANTPQNTPDALFNEYAFIWNDYGPDNAYWLRCLSDAAILAGWNAGLSPAAQKHLQYCVRQKDTSDHPAYGLDGWIRFGLTSYLLCQNDYTSLAIDVQNAQSVQLDFSVTQRLGAPDGDDQAYSGDDFFRYRLYKPTSSGGVGGVVVVNGNIKTTKTYRLGFNAEDELGNVYIKNGTISLKPLTGRILFRDNDQMSVRLLASSDSVTAGQTVDLTLQYTNVGKTELRSVLVRAQVPTEAAYVAGSAEQSGGRYDSTTNTVSWIVPTVAAGATGSAKFKVTAK